MKLYSVSFTALVFGLIGLSLSLPELRNNVNPTVSREGRATNVESKRSFGSWHDGTWPASSGYHTYGKFYIDATGIPTMGGINVSYSAHDVPNRFYLQDECGLGIYSTSGWVGSASYPGPWGMSISTAASSNLSVLKAAGCNLYSVAIETSTSSTISDYWSATF